MKIGDEVFVHGYVDEIRKDTVIIRNDGGYFGTVPDEIKITESYTLSKDEVDNLMSDLQKGDDLLTDDDLRLLINDAIKEMKEEHDKVTQWIKDNADFIKEKEMARLVAGEKKIINCKDFALSDLGDVDTGKKYTPHTVSHSKQIDGQMDFTDYLGMPYQFDNMTGSMNL